MEREVNMVVVDKVVVHGKWEETEVVVTVSLTTTQVEEVEIGLTVRCLEDTAPDRPLPEKVLIKNHLQVRSISIEYIIINWNSLNIVINVFNIDTTGRKRLVLAPRTIEAPVNAMAESSKSSSIYGGAKPRDEKLKTYDK